MVLVGVVIVAAAAFFLMKGDGDDSATNTENNTTQVNVNDSNGQVQPSSSTKSASMKDLMAGESQTCTYSDAGYTGTVYVANNKMRMDYTGTSNGVTVTSHSIIDGNVYYSWIDGQPNGFKFDVSKTGAGQAGPNQNVDINRTFDYNCSAWSVDNSKFTLPAGVQFTDFAAVGSFGM